MLTITGLNGTIYGQQQGIVLDNNFISKEEFRKIFKDLLDNESESVYIFKQNLLNIQKITHITQSKKGKVSTTTEFLNHLETISQLFSQLVLKGLGGNISLLSTFNLTRNRKTSSYYLMDENDLPSRTLPNGAKVYLNSQQQLENLKNDTRKLKKINDNLISHLNGFNNQLRQKKTQTSEERSKMYVWAYYNMTDRFKQQRNLPHPIAMARYFWGGGQLPGYIGEAFAAHMAIMHPNFMHDQHVSKLKSSVITEHGGAGSDNLFNLLYSTKSNTMSQLSGDVVVVDGEGRVIFNIQSKVSRYGKYDFTITYQQFIKNLYLFVEIYENALYNGANNQDIDILFEKFATKAWVPIQQEIEKQTSELIDTDILNPLVKHINKI